ncbi:MAG TPA: hypothetical protein VG165_02420 [Solirubrobacteraceae bacterium]|nr:hypothetical protein [Solirubrobacteraceae bacterium]
MRQGPSPGRVRQRLVFIFGSLAVVATMVAGLATHVLAVAAGVVAILAALATFAYILAVEIDDDRS